MTAILSLVDEHRNRGQNATDDQLSERRGDPTVGLNVRLNVLPHCESHVGVPDPLAERLPVDLGIPASRRVAVPHVVQVDEGQASYGKSGV